MFNTHESRRRLKRIKYKDLDFHSYYNNVLINNAIEAYHNRFDILTQKVVYQNMNQLQKSFYRNQVNSSYGIGGLHSIGIKTPYNEILMLKSVIIWRLKNYHYSERYIKYKEERADYIE